ncbi:MAG: STAS domain-containing protein, partial [Bacteroidota bacterium]
VILDLKGRLTYGEGAGVLKDTIEKILELGRQHFLLNLKQVSGIDSTGIGELVFAFGKVSDRGGQLKLLQPPSKVAKTLDITKLNNIIQVFDNEIEAVESFS